MSRILAWCLTGIVMLWPAALHGQEHLNWKFKENDRFFAEWSLFKLDRSRQGTQLSEGLEELRIVCRFTVVKAERERTVLEQQFVHVSSRGAGAPGIGGVNLLKGSMLQVTLGKNLEIEKIEGIEPVLGLMPGGQLFPPQQAALTGMKNLVCYWLKDLFIPLPAQDSKTNDTWQETVRLEGAVVGWKKVYSSAGSTTTAEGKRQRVKVRAEPIVSAEEVEKKRFKGLTTTSSRYQGELLADTRKGRLVRIAYQSHLNFDGSQQTFPGAPPAKVQSEMIAIVQVHVSAANPLETTAKLEVQRVAHEQAAQDLPKKITNSLGMQLVLVPPGKFSMGATPYGQQEAGQAVEVEITRPIHMGAHEVTVGQYRQFVAETRYRTEAERQERGIGFDKQTGKMLVHPRFSWKNPGWNQSDRHPVVSLSWEDAKEFCLWLSKKEGKNYRLPTEAEWEYACRAGSKTAYSCGDEAELLVKFGNVVDVSAKKVFPQWQAHRGDDGYVFTAPVGSFKPNDFGLYDMHGNALEWCEDWYFHYPLTGLLRDPQGAPLGLTKVQRGGSFADFPQQCTSANRVAFPPDAFCISSGFRVVLADGPLTSFARKPTWTGQTVMPRDPNVLANFNKTNPQALPNFAMKVLQERFGLLRVTVNGRDTVIGKEEVLPIETAMTNYSEQLKLTVLPQIYVLRAMGYTALGQHKNALQDMEEAINLDDDNAWLYANRAYMHQNARRFAEAAQDLGKALELKEDNVTMLNALAWLRATCPDAEVRNGKDAIEYAEKARTLTKSRDGNVLDTLAAAYAEDGQFEEAVRWQTKALQDVGFGMVAGAAARERLKLYESKTPYRQP